MVLEKYHNRNNSWHRGAGIGWTSKKSYWLQEKEGVGNDRAEGTSAIGDRGQAAISLTWEAIGHRAHAGIFESFKLEGSYVGDLLYP